MPKVEFKPLKIMPVQSKYFYLLQIFKKSIRYAFMLRLIDDIKINFTNSPDSSEGKNRAFLSLKDEEDLKYCRLIYQYLLLATEEFNDEDPLSTQQHSLKFCIDEKVKVNIKEEDEDNVHIRNEVLRKTISMNPTPSIVKDILEICKFLVSNSSPLNVSMEGIRHEEKPKTRKILLFPSTIIYNLLKIHAPSLKPIPSLIVNSEIHNILYRYAAKYIKEKYGHYNDHHDYDNEGNSTTRAVKMEIELETGSKIVKAHKSLVSYAISFVMRNARYSDVSKEFLEINKLNAALINLYKHKPEVIVRVLTKLNLLENRYLCPREGCREELCRKLKHYLKDLLRNTDNDDTVYKLISEYIPKLLLKPGIEQKLNLEEMECLGYLLSIIPAFKFLNKVSDEYAEKIVSDLSHNLLNVLIMINAWENFMVVLPSIKVKVLSLDLDSMEINEVKERFNRNSNHEIDLAILGWIPDNGVESTMKFMPTLTLIETKLPKIDLGERGKAVVTIDDEACNSLLSKIGTKKQQLQRIHDFNTICNSVASDTLNMKILCKAALAVPYEIISSFDRKNFKNREGKEIPVIPLESLIDPTKFMVTLYTLHTT